MAAQSPSYQSSPSTPKQTGQVFFQTNQLQNSEFVDVQTAQFIKTHTHIQPAITSQQTVQQGGASLQNSLNQSLNFRGSGKLPRDLSNATLTGGINIPDTVRLSINQDILQNSSVIGGNVAPEESSDPISVDQAYIYSGNYQNRFLSPERQNQSKKSDKNVFKDIMIHRTTFFLAISILISLLDCIYLYKFMNSSSENTSTDFTAGSTDEVIFWLLVGILIFVSTILFFLASRGSLMCISILKKQQITLTFTHVATHICYFQLVYQIITEDNRLTDPTISAFRTLNAGIITYFFSFLIRNKLLKYIQISILLLYYSTRFLVLNFMDNLIEVVILVLALTQLFYMHNLAKKHVVFKAKYAISKKFRHILHKEPSLISMNKYVQAANNGGTGGTGAGGVLIAQDSGSFEQIKMQSFHNNQCVSPQLYNSNNSNALLVSNGKVTGTSFASPQSSQRAFKDIGSQNLIVQQPLNNQLILDKQIQQIPSSMEPQFKKPTILNQLGKQQSGIIHLSKSNNNSPTQRIKRERDDQQQMTKISELDLEQDIAKTTTTPAKLSNQTQNRSNDFNGTANITVSMHSQDKELKSLVEQVIEVDGVVVFDAESEMVVFANQNILALLETDQSHLLKELHSLKQLHFLQDDKSANTDFSTSNLLKFLIKDSLNANLSNSQNGPHNNTTGKISSSKMGSNPLLNEVIEEEETEIEAKQTDKVNSQSPVLKAALNSHSRSEQGEIISYNSTSQDRVSQNALESPTKQSGSIRKGSSGNSLQQQIQQAQGMILRQKPSPLQISLQNSKKVQQYSQKARTPTAQRNAPSSLLSPNSVEPMGMAANDEDEENYSLRPGKKKTESIFKTLSPQFSSSQNKIESNPVNGSNSNSEIFNITPNHEPISFTNIIQKRDTLEQLFPSFISSISFPRKSLNGQGSSNTIERERNNTLKDIIEDVRIRNATVGGAIHRKNTVLSRSKKMLVQKRLLNYSQQHEVIMNNMVLYKENSSKMYLAKYSVIEHAGRILHTITIRDMSNEVFEVILERQSTLLVEELYKHLNFTEISQVVNKSVAQLKELKHRVKSEDYSNCIRPVRLNLRIFRFLMKDIFDIRSLQQRTFSLQKDYFDLQNELERIKKMTEEYRSDIVVNFYYDKRIPIQVINDAERVCQILTNLLVNTCKLVKTKKIFLKAKMCEGEHNSATPLLNQGSTVKIIIENRELKKPQKEQILKAFNNPNSDSLAYHFFITNLLAKQVSNNRYSLEITSNSGSDYLKFKFHIHLFTNVATAEVSYLHKPQSGLSSNTLSARKLSKDINPSLRLAFQQNSLSYLDYENINEEGGTNLPQTSKLDKGHIKSTSKNSSSNHESKERMSNSTPEIVPPIKSIEQIVQKKKHLTVEKFSPPKEHPIVSNQNGTVASGEFSEMSERLDKLKIKDFDNINLEFPPKFIQEKRILDQ